MGQACALHHWWKWCVCFVYFLKQSIYFLLDKNYCRKMQSVWEWTSARWVNYPWQQNIKKYIVQTFEPCVKQRFAPKLAVCYWLYNVNLIKNPKLFIILVWRGGSTSSEGVPQLQRLDEAALCYEHHTWKVYKLKGKTPLAALFKLM